MNPSSNLLLAVTLAWTAFTPAASAAQDHRMDWWREARFGMFIHWGPVSLTGKEISWSRANSNPLCPNQGDTPVAVYDNLYRQFDPTNFNAAEWASIARDAGMKYVVLTAKHGDGFLLWDSKVDPYNMMATPFHRDICAELAPAVRQAGLHMGWYFSPMDWRDPDCRSPLHNDRFVTKIQAELRELLSNYGPIDELWFDLDGKPTMWRPQETYHLARTLQPRMVINNRLEMGSFEEWSHQDKLPAYGDFLTPEQRIGAYNDRVPWETCMTIGTQWSWKPADDIKTPAAVIHILARCAGGDGNLLLDVGPMPDGRIEPRQVDVLRDVGGWMARNGDSIYGTRGGPWKPRPAFASTRKGNVIYAHILNVHATTVELPAIARRILTATLLAGGEAVAVKQTSDSVILSLPSRGRDPNDTVVKLQLDGSAMDLPAVAVPADIRATASNVFGNDAASWGPQQAFDGDPQTRWATDSGTKQAWIAGRLSKPGTFNGARIREAYPGRVKKFELQFLQGDQWRTVCSGAGLGEDAELQFPAVSGQEFRLNILEASDGPTIAEMELIPTGSP